MKLRWWHRLARRGTARVGLVILLVFAGVAVFAPRVAPHGYAVQHRDRILEGPSRDFPLGTDRLGRCVFSRVVWGTRISFTVAVVAVGIGATLGTVLGAVSGYKGGRLDYLVVGLVDLVWSFPTLLLAIALTAILTPGLGSVMIALGLVTWPQYARVVRGQFLAYKQKEFVEAARAAGASDFRVIWRHIFPNSLSPLIVVATLDMANAILVEATFSYLGLGAQPPQPSWGSILSMGRDFIYQQPLLSIAPGIAIMLVVLGFNLVGDALRDALDPKLSAR